MFTCQDGKGGKLSSQASKMLYKPPGAVYIASYKEALDQSDCWKLFVQLWNYTNHYYNFLKCDWCTNCYILLLMCKVEGSVVCSTLERAVRVWALAGDIELCAWARHLTLTVPLSTQVYKWVLVNCWGKPNKLQGSDLWWTSIPSRGSRNTFSCFMLQKPG